MTEPMPKLGGFHHVAYRCKDAGETTPPTQAENSMTLVRYGVTSKSVKP